MARKWVVAVALMLVAVAGVAALLARNPKDEPPPATPASRAPFFPTWDTSYGVPEALLGDAILVRHDDCLFARPSIGDKDLLLVWPEGFRLEGDRRVLDTSGNVVATIGDALRMGGGLTPSPSRAEELIGEPIPRPCRSPGESVWLVGEVF